MSKDPTTNKTKSNQEQPTNLDFEANSADQETPQTDDVEIEQTENKPEEEISYENTTILITITLVPEDGHEAGRGVILSAGNLGDGPVNKWLREKDIPLPTVITEAIYELKASWGNRKTRHKLLQAHKSIKPTPPSISDPQMLPKSKQLSFL